MTKQPFLTDFPLTVFASAKRRLQVAIRHTSALITRHSLSGYAVLFEDILPGAFLASIDPTQRQRSFGHLSVFWAWLAQILEAHASCQKAVSLIQSWCQTSGLSIPSSDTSSYCKARSRLSMDFLKAVHQRHLSSRAIRVSAIRVSPRMVTHHSGQNTPFGTSPRMVTFFRVWNIIS